MLAAVEEIDRNKDVSVSTATEAANESKVEDECQVLSVNFISVKEAAST
jgi:hypothetical protein